MSGEISQPRCGLSDADMLRLARVDVVVHSAADIGFDPPISESLRQNYHVRCGPSSCGHVWQPSVACLSGMIIHGNRCAYMCSVTHTRSLAEQQATAEIMKVAAALPQLRAFVYVSTAFVNGGQPQARGKTYMY